MSKKLMFLALVAVFATSTSTFAMHHILGGASSEEKAACKEACHGKSHHCAKKCEKYAECMRKHHGKRDACGGKFRPE